MGGVTPNSPPPFPGIFHCYSEYAALRGQPGSDLSVTELGLQSDLRVYLHLRHTWLAFSRSRDGGGGRGWAHLEVSEREEELREPRQLEEEDVAGKEQLHGAVG